jgi:hypothetical protein
MTVQKKIVAAPAQESIDEIDEIMNEIEELQQSMNSTPEAPAPKAAAIAEEPNVMEEFQAGSSDVSMEETLGDLKDDEPGGPNLIDQAMEAEAAREAESQSDVDELLDEAEVEALDDEIAAAEEAAIQEIQEEVTPMSDSTQRRGRPGPVHHGDSKNGSVGVTLRGDMTLRLSYEFEGQEVVIGFADGALRVELSDGTEFKIPVRRNPLRKVA